MTENPRKRAFKEAILDRIRSEPAGAAVARSDLIAFVRSDLPELCDDSEECYPGCRSMHPKWRHEFDRSIYDLTATRPAKLRSSPHRRGYYLLG
jgi:hypothetical protein